MALFGKIESFNPKTYNISDYIKRENQYVYIYIYIYIYISLCREYSLNNDIFGGIFKVIGSDTYSFLRISYSPLAPSAKTLQVFFWILKMHLKLQPILIAERYAFYCIDHEKK